jgi:tetratricopeptide (TPR) repeat protein
LAIEGRYDEALRETDRALALERRPETLDLRGRLLFRAGAHAEALADGEAALELNARLPAARDLVGTLLLTDRRLDRAVELMASGRLGQKTAASRFILAEAYRLRGDHDLARKCYEQAAKLAPFYVKFDPRRSEGIWACALAQLGRWKEADRRIRETLERNPSDTTALYARALRENETGEFDALEETLKEMLLASLGVEVAGALTDPQFTPLLAEKRFRELLAWALGAQRQARERVLTRLNPPA